MLRTAIASPGADRLYSYEMRLDHLKAMICKKAGIGFLTGMILGNLIAWISGGFSHTIVSQLLVSRAGGRIAAIAVQTLVSGIYGAAGVSGMILYNVENWSLAKATIVHCLIVTVLYVPMALLLGWARNITDILIVELVQLIAFFLIWLVMFLRYRTKVRDLNKLMRERKELTENRC